MAAPDSGYFATASSWPEPTGHHRKWARVKPGAVPCAGSVEADAKLYSSLDAGDLMDRVPAVAEIIGTECPWIIAIGWR